MKKALAIFCLRLFLISINFIPVVQSEPFTEESLQELIKKNSVKSVKELVPLLPVEFRKNFTFVYNSRSPFKESISPLYPRVVLFSKDARQVLTFTGDPDKPGYDYLEMMTFSDEKAEFKFSVYALEDALKSKHKISAEDTNCKRCHGEDPRPINDSYPLWPGFYGSIQDTFPKDSVVGRAEHKNFIQFLQKSAQTGVYKDLIFPKGSPVSPYLDPEKFSVDKQEGDLNNFKFLPNTRFGMALSELNRKRIYRKLSNSEKFRKKQKEFLAILLDCPNSSRKKSNIDKIKAELEKENRERLIRLGSNPDDPTERINDMQELKFAVELEQMNWLAEASEVSRADWSMALEANSLSFFDGILSGIWDGKSYYLKEDLILEIMQNLAAQAPEKMKKYVSINFAYSWLGLPYGNRININKARNFCSQL